MIARSGAQPVIFRAPAIIGPYSVFSVPGTQWEANPAQAVEQCQLTYLGPGHWQANFVIPAIYELCVSESFDNMATWTPRVKTLDYSQQGTNHQFSEWCMIPQNLQTAVPAPANYPAYPTRRFFRLK